MESFIEFYLWTERESNPRHKDFQSFALPTELSVLTREQLYNLILKNTNENIKKTEYSST